MEEQVAFTIIYQAIRYNRLEEYNKGLVICLHPLWKETEEILW